MMGITYSNPQKNADINKSKSALVELIDELRTRYARKNDAWSEAEALAADRLRLLRRENTIRFSRGKQCFFCDKYPLLNHKVGSDYEKVYIDYHADDCEWAKELDGE